MKNKLIQFQITHIKLFLVIFMIGFVVGILFTNLFGKTYISGTGILSEYFLNKYKYVEINSARLFLETIKMRSETLILIWLLGSTILGLAAICGYLCWLGFTTGIFLTVAVMKFGIKGIFICLGGMLPQYFIYIPLFLFFSDRVLRMALSVLGIQDNMHKKGERQLWMDYAILLLGSLFVLMIGCILESYINPYMLQALLKKLD